MFITRYLSIIDYVIHPCFRTLMTTKPQLKDGFYVAIGGPTPGLSKQ